MPNTIIKTVTLANLGTTFDLGVTVPGKININQTKADWNETNIASPAYIANKPTVSGPGVVNDNLTSTSATTALSANQGKILNEAKANKIVGATGGKVAISSPNGLDLVESTLSQAVLEGLDARVTAGSTGNTALAARVTALETAQPTFNDTIVVTALPTTGQIQDALYLVTAGTNKDKAFYWDGTVFVEALNKVRSFASALPATGQEDVIYVVKTGANKGVYFWDGTAFQPSSTVSGVSSVVTSAGNTVTVTTNGTPSSAPIINSVGTDAVAGVLTATINGIASTPVTLTPAKLGLAIDSTTAPSLLSGAKLASLNALINKAETIHIQNFAGDFTGVDSPLFPVVSANGNGITIQKFQYRKTAGTVAGTDTLILKVNGVTVSGGTLTLSTTNELSTLTLATPLVLVETDEYSFGRPNNTTLAGVTSIFNTNN